MLLLTIVFVWAIIANWLAYRKGFYSFPKGSEKLFVPIKNKQFFASFGIYLIFAIVGIPLLARIFLSYLKGIDPDLSNLPILAATATQAISSFVIFLLLLIYVRSQKDHILQNIWKNHSRPPNMPKSFDFSLGVMTWFLSFPLVTILGEVVDNLLKSLFNLPYYEQTAVKFVKLAMNSPMAFFFALFSVILMAPLIEEFLFRGILLNYLKRLVGRHGAILLSSIIFALFHFFPGQGLGNISLLLSLFVLGGFLGFLYERQGSLWAPIGLHMMFNAISAFRILLPEIMI